MRFAPLIALITNNINDNAAQRAALFVIREIGGALPIREILKLYPLPHFKYREQGNGAGRQAAGYFPKIIGRADNRGGSGPHAE